jgi:nucleoside-diphosphate-sugar epimerase
MNVFVTGATGFVGRNITLKLASEGYLVHALYRDINKTKGLEHQNIKLFKGDILLKESLYAGMKDCDVVFHTAAFVSVWTKDPTDIESLNVNGTVNVFETALDLSVKRIIYTSTAGVFGPSGNGMTDEKQPYPFTFFNRYEETKARIEQTIIPRYIASGLEIVTLNPTRIYGPGPLSDANSLSKIFKLHLEGKIGLLPSDGKSIGNYAFIDDVAQGHILAMKNGRSGEKYILGGENISYIDLMKTAARISGKKIKFLRIPVFVMFLISWISVFLANITGRKPLITPGFVKKFLPDWKVSSEKSKRELGYNPIGIEEGIRCTVKWLIKEYNL